MNQHKDQLSPSGYEQYKQDVLKRFIKNQQPSLVPEAYVLSGQPGAGKSTLSEMAHNQLKAKGGSVLIDVDACRELHPNYQQFKQEDSLTSAQRTHSDAARVADDLRNVAMSKGYNIIEDGTLKNPEWAKNLVTDLKNHHYTVYSVGLCVTPEVSWQGCLDRYKVTGRAVDEKLHNDAVPGVAQSQQELVRQGKIDSVALYNREGQIYYKSAMHHQNGQEQEKTCQIIANVYNRNGGRELAEDPGYKRQPISEEAKDYLKALQPRRPTPRPQQEQDKTKGRDRGR